MKAVIMAGGQGRRLRAVSGERPKPLVPFLGRPLMEHIILLLKAQGFEDICASLNYRAEDIISAFGDGSSLGVRLSYAIEEKPLGTAGGVRNCRDFYGDEDFLVISGDAACDFALSELMERHKKEKAAVTLALFRNPEPLSYGLALTDENDLLRCFIEKPCWSHVVTDLVNTGIYVLSPRALDALDADTPCDFAKELFPALMKKGEKLIGRPMEGYWCDVGTPLSYFRCCCDALEGRLKISPGPGFAIGGEREDEPPRESSSASLDYPCRSRAALMGALSREFLPLGADYSDGLRLSAPRFSLHISPLVKSSALHVAVSAADGEYAASLALTAKELMDALEQ